MRIFPAIAISLCLLASVAQSQAFQGSGSDTDHAERLATSRQAPAENFTGSVRSILCSRRPRRRARPALSSRSNPAHVPRGTPTRWAKS